MKELSIKKSLNNILASTYFALSLASAGEGLDKIIDYNIKKNIIFEEAYRKNIDCRSCSHGAYNDALFVSSFMSDYEIYLGIGLFGVAGLCLGAGINLMRKKEE